MNLEVRDDSDACWGGTIVYVEHLIENAMTDANMDMWTDYYNIWYLVTLYHINNKWELIEQVIAYWKESELLSYLRVP